MILSQGSIIEVRGGGGTERIECGGRTYFYSVEICCVVYGVLFISQVYGDEKIDDREWGLFWRRSFRRLTY